MTSTTVGATRPWSYGARVLLWDLRRRWLVFRMRRRHASTYEVIDALRRDAVTHPHPLG